MAEEWGRGERDSSARTPLQGGEPGGVGAPALPPAEAPPGPSGEEPSAAEQAAVNQERALESGEENVV